MDPRPATGPFEGQSRLFKVVRHLQVPSQPLLHLGNLLCSWGEVPPEKENAKTNPMVVIVLHHLSEEPGPGGYRGFFSTERRGLVDLRMASQAGSYFNNTSSSFPTGSPISSTWRNCRLGRHLSSAKNLVCFSPFSPCGTRAANLQWRCAANQNSG